MDRDVLHVLAADHVRLGRLVDRALAARAERARAVLFNEFAQALAAHLTVVDCTILPALKGLGWSGVTSDVLADHMALKRLLAESLGAERDAAVLEDAMQRLAPRVKKQCAAERDKFAPVLRRGLDEHQRALLALEAEQHLTRLLGEAPPSEDDVGLVADASALIEEAYVVLGSLPLRDTPSPPKL